MANNYKYFKHSDIQYCTCDHVFDVVCVSRAVDVRIVSLLCLILDVGGCYGDAPLPLLRGVVNVTILLELCPPSLC